MANSITEIMKRLREGRVVKNTEDNVVFLTKDKSTIRVKVKGEKYVLHQWDYKKAWVPFMEVSSKEEIAEYIDTEIMLNIDQMERLKDLESVSESEEPEAEDIDEATDTPDLTQEVIDYLEGMESYLQKDIAKNPNEYGYEEGYIEELGKLLGDTFTNLVSGSSEDDITGDLNPREMYMVLETAQLYKGKMKDASSVSEFILDRRSGSYIQSMLGNIYIESGSGTDFIVMSKKTRSNITKHIKSNLDLANKIIASAQGVYENEEPEVEKEEIEEAAQIAPSKEFFSKRANRKFKVTFPEDTLYTELTFFLDFFELDGMTPEEIAEKYGFEVNGSDVIIPAGTYEAQDPPKGEPNTTFYLNMNGELFEFVFDFESDDPETFYINESVKESDEEDIEDEDIDEGLFDSKKDKQKKYDDEIQNIFKDNTMRVVTNIISAVETLLEDCADYTSDIQNFTKQVENITKAAANDIKKSPEKLFSTLLNTGRKHATDSTGVEELQDILADYRKLQKVPKIGYPAASYLIEKVAATLIPKLEKYADFLKKEYKDNEY